MSKNQENNFQKSLKYSRETIIPFFKMLGYAGFAIWLIWSGRDVYEDLKTEIQEILELKSEVAELKQMNTLGTMERLGKNLGVSYSVSINNITDCDTLKDIKYDIIHVMEQNKCK